MRKKCDRELCACLFKLSAFATRHNAISPWDGGLVITCTGWALSRRDRLSEGCLSRGVLDINMWKISPFFFLLTAKSIQRYLASEQCCFTSAKSFSSSLHSKLCPSARQNRGRWCPAHCYFINAVMHSMSTSPHTKENLSPTTSAWCWDCILLGGLISTVWIFALQVRNLGFLTQIPSSAWFHSG